MRLAFLGTPDAAVPSLEALVSAGHEVVVVVTPPDRRRGRGGESTPTPVGRAARRLGLALSHDLADVTVGGPELAVVVAYGELIPESLLSRLAMLNVHFSLLPRWRGAAPVERAILAGDEMTGVCVMGLEVTLDTGPVYARAQTPVDDKTAASLTAELAQLGAELLVGVLAQDPLPTPVAQFGASSYARKLRPEELVLDPHTPVELLARTVRLGRAFTFVDGRRLAVRRASVRSGTEAEPGTVAPEGHEIVLYAVDGALTLHEVVPEGARAMAAADWWRGRRSPPSPSRWGRLTERAP